LSEENQLTVISLVDLVQGFVQGSMQKEWNLFKEWVSFLEEQDFMEMEESFYLG
jgi:hypothetical protein